LDVAGAEGGEIIVEFAQIPSSNDDFFGGGRDLDAIGWVEVDFLNKGIWHSFAVAITQAEVKTGRITFDVINPEEIGIKPFKFRVVIICSLVIYPGVFLL